MTDQYAPTERYRDHVRPGRGTMIATMAAAGVAGPILFTLGVVAQDLIRRDEYSPVRRQISELEASPYGWVQVVNFAVFGLLTLAFAVGMHLTVRPSRIGAVGASLLAWNGLGLVLAAVFPLRQGDAGAIYDPGNLHRINGAIFFLSIGLAMVVLSRRLAADPAWRGLAGYVLWTGIVLLTLDVITGPLSRLAPSLLDSWSGALQRATLAVWFPCLIVLALRLRRVTRNHP